MSGLVAERPAVGPAAPSAHSAGRLGRAAAWLRGAVGAAVADGFRPPDGLWLDLWHLVHEAERVAAELAPGDCLAPPRLWSADPPAYGTTVPAAVTLELADGRLARFRFERVERR